MLFVFFRDRCRTAGNLYSQNLCVAVVQKFAALPEEDGSQDDSAIEIVVENDTKPKSNKTNGKATKNNGIKENEKLLQESSNDFQQSKI